MDCPNTIIFAQGLGIPIKRIDVLEGLLTGDCCQATGVDCVSDRVIEIHWQDSSLNGTINGTSIPTRMTLLDLYNNILTGPLPSSFPDGLEILAIDTNRLTGSIPLLPNSVWKVHLNGNILTGDLPLFPSSIQDLWLGTWNNFGNHFSGSLRLSKPINVRIYDNWITDVVIEDSSLLTSCDLSYNPLLGNPNIAGLTMCTKNGLYSVTKLPKTGATVRENKTSTLFSHTISGSLTIPNSVSVDESTQDAKAELSAPEINPF